MVTFSKVLNTLGFARFKRRSRAAAASDDLCAPYSTLSALSGQQQAEEFSVLVTEGADFESAKITTPDGAWERRWRRRAPSCEPPTRSAELSRSTLLAAQDQVWDAARAAAGAVALTISAVLLDDSIPPDARKHFQLGLQLLEGAIAADDAAPEPDSACAEASSPIPQAQLHFQPRERSASDFPHVPFTSGPRDRYSRPTLDRWLLDYGPAGGVHKHLASVGSLIFDLALTKDEALYRASGAPFHVGVEFAQFQRAAVEPRVRTLVVLSRQFPWPVEVHAAAGEGEFVRVSDVLRAMRKVAHYTLRETEFQLALHTPGGRRRLARAYGRRMRRLGESGEITPLCLVDYLGDHTVLGGLRKDVDNAMLKELIPRPWLPGTAETLHLVADFVSHEHVRSVLEHR